MPSATFRLVFVLVSLTGTLVASGYGQQPDPAVPVLKKQPEANERQGKPLKYRLISSGSSEDVEATKLGFKTFRFSYAFIGFSSFKAPDGERLMVRYGRFSSANEAKRYFDFRLSKLAKTVLEQKVAADKNGDSIGYRAELVLQPDKAGRPQVAVMWTSGPHFRVIFSKSLSNAVELEKEYEKR